MRNARWIPGADEFNRRERVPDGRRFFTSPLGNYADPAGDVVVTLLRNQAKRLVEKGIR